MFFQPHLAGAHHAACCIDSVTKKCKLWLLRSDHSTDHLRATERVFDFWGAKLMQNSQCHIQRLSGVTGTSPLKKHTPPIPQRYLILINIAFSTAFPFLTVLQCASLIILMWLSLSLSLMAASRTIHHWGLPSQSNLQLRNFQSFFSYIHKKKVCI